MKNPWGKVRPATPRPLSPPHAPSRLTAEGMNHARRFRRAAFARRWRAEHGRLHRRWRDVSIAAGFPSALCGRHDPRQDSNSRLRASVEPGCNRRHGHDGQQTADVSASGPPDATGRATMPTAMIVRDALGGPWRAAWHRANGLAPSPSWFPPAIPARPVKCGPHATAMGSWQSLPGFVFGRPENRLAMLAGSRCQAQWELGRRSVGRGQRSAEIELSHRNSFQLPGLTLVYRTGIYLDDESSSFGGGNTTRNLRFGFGLGLP